MSTLFEVLKKGNMEGKTVESLSFYGAMYIAAKDKLPAQLNSGSLEDHTHVVIEVCSQHRMYYRLGPCEMSPEIKPPKVFKRKYRKSY